MASNTVNIGSLLKTVRVKELSIMCDSAKCQLEINSLPSCVYTILESPTPHSAAYYLAIDQFQDGL